MYSKWKLEVEVYIKDEAGKKEFSEGRVTGMVLLVACKSRREMSVVCTKSISPEKKYHQSTLPLLAPPFGGNTKVPATGLQPSSGPLSSPLIKLAIEAV